MLLMFNYTVNKLMQILLNYILHGIKKILINWFFYNVVYQNSECKSFNFVP